MILYEDMNCMTCVTSEIRDGKLFCKDKNCEVSENWICSDYMEINRDGCDD